MIKHQPHIRQSSAACNYNPEKKSREFAYSEAAAKAVALQHRLLHVLLMLELAMLFSGAQHASASTLSLRRHLPAPAADSLDRKTELLP